MTVLPEFGWGLFAYIGIFLGVLVAFDGLRQMLSRSEAPRDARNRRMRLIAAGASTGEVLSLLKPKEAPWRLSGFPFIGTLPSDLNKAGVTVKPAVFVGFGLAGALAIAMVLTPRLGPVLALAPGLLAGFVAPALIVRRMRDKRMQQLVHQLPDALDLMARGLKVGHPLNATIGSVARDMQDPVASEFGLILDQISYGDDLVNAFRDFADRVDLEDVRYLSTAVAIQNGTGGDLSRILMTLGKVIRGRITMRKRIMAISSEGRMTAIFMSLLPLFIFGSTSITAPTYYAGVSADPMFRPVAVAVVLLVVGNYLAMRRLVNIRI